VDAVLEEAVQVNSSSTRPMKKGRPRIHPIRDKPGVRGRPKATGIFETRSEFEAACLDKHNQGWSLRRISTRFGICYLTVKRAISDAKKNLK
jgi:hypothetical protein